MNLTKNKYLTAIRGETNPELLSLRGKFFVYFLIKKSDIIYIGSTTDIQKRICTHKSSFWSNKWFDLFRVMECKNEKEMHLYEKRWIELFKPERNKILKNGISKYHSIKTSKALMDHFEKYANKKKETLNSLVVKLMVRESKYKSD